MSHVKQMESSRKKQRRFSIVLILSLLMHLLAVILFFNYAFKTTQLVQWHRAKERTPVFFYPEPQNIQIAATQKRGSLEGTTSERQPQKDETTLDPAIQEEKLHKDETKKQEAAASETSNEKKVNLTIDEAKAEEFEKQLSPEELQMLALKNLIKYQDMIQPPPKNIIEKTRSMAQEWGLEGKDDQWIDSADCTSSPEGLRYLGYINKISACLKQEIQSRSPSFNPFGHQSSRIFFRIDATGQITCIDYVDNTITPIQKILTHDIKNASPFPPIPNHLNIDYLDFGYTFEVSHIKNGIMVGYSLIFKKPSQPLVSR